MPSGIFEEYRRSLKMPEAEELFDLMIYRPLGFLFVKGIYRTPLTPNMVTMISVAFGLTAAYLFSGGTKAVLIWGALWYAAANILDCADGQLARLQGSGTLFGRVVDGIGDYVASIAIFLGIGLGLEAAGMAAWGLVIAAGISSGLHAMFFDHYQSEYISTVRGERNFLEREMEQFRAELHRLQKERGRFVPRVVLEVYLRYLQTQERSSTREGESISDPMLYRSMNLRMIRVWSFLGPTTNRTLLIVCALAGRLDLYLWAVVAGGNAWLLVCYLLQRRIHRRILAQIHSEVLHA